MKAPPYRTPGFFSPLALWSSSISVKIFMPPSMVLTKLSSSMRMTRVIAITGATYGQSHRTDVSLRVITDHIRSATMT